MAIVITGITPLNPVSTFTGATVTFEANYYEDTNSPITSAQWQLSNNYDVVTQTGTWSSISGANNNVNLGDTNGDGEIDYSSTYTTGTLNPGNSGNYYRIVLTSSLGEILNSNVYLIGGLEFGYRVLQVTSSPEITIVAEDLGTPVRVAAVGGSVTADATATYINRETDSSDDLTPLNITWQVSYNFDPNDPTLATWNNIGTPNIFNGGTDVGDTTINITVFDDGTGKFVKRSELIISDIQFGLNNAYFRAVYTSSGVNNSPLTTGAVFQILVNPEITIIGQPGTNPGDSQSPVYCWSDNGPDAVGPANPSNGIVAGERGGDIRIRVNAVSSAGFLSTLTYQWQFKAFSDNGLSTGTPALVDGDPGVSGNFIDVEDRQGISFLIQSANSELRLTRVMYADRYVFRCIITGGFEVPVTSNEYTLHFRDNQIPLSSILGSTSSNEDFYGNISGRELLTDKPLRNLTFAFSANVSPYYGQAGSIKYQWQRLNPGLNETVNSNWVDISDATVYRQMTPVGTESNPLNPGSTQILVESNYTTPYLRINQSDNTTPLDQGAKYRVQVQSSSVYNVSTFTSTGVKNYTPFYIQTNALSLTREIFINTQPANVEVFATDSASFSVGASATSFPVGQTFTYQWQWARITNNNPGVYTNLSNGNFFTTTGQTGPSTGNTVSGVNSSTLLITNVSDEIKNYAFRVVINLAGTAGSVTSSFARIVIAQDKFTQITSINNLYLNELETASWSVTASTLSLGTIAYQWQKSTNQGVTWINLVNSTNISGATSNSLTITSVQDPEDTGLYRLRLTSRGGIIAFSNVVLLSISAVEIIILQNFPSNLVFVENSDVFPAFFVDAVSSIGEEVSYRWEYSRDNGATYTGFGVGVDFRPDTDNPFTPNPFFKTNSSSTTWDDNKVRCRLSIPSLGTNYAYSNVGTLDIRRRFFYFADTPTKLIETGTPFSIDLSPSYTGSDTPTYNWQYSSNGGTTWQSVNLLTPAPVNGLSVLFAASTPTSWNGYKFRCEVTLPLVDDFVYVRNNTQQIDVFSGVGYTAVVTLNVISEKISPKYYSQENGKTGAAVGTVVCISKPPGFVDDNDTATVDDIERWGCSFTGSSLSTQSSVSSATSGNAYTSNLNFLNRNQNWINTSTPDGFKTPRWNIKDDRFPGFIELRGQWLLKSEFPLLYSVIGDVYGSTTTQFKLPNPYGKKIMGTGAVSSRTGRVSVVPLYNPDGSSGGDRNNPGTIGGVYLYERSRQLPPGSPSVAGQNDGSAGVSDPATFALGNFRTDGWEEAENLLEINFRGNFIYKVGPMTSGFVATPSPHVHGGSVVGWFDGNKAASSCARSYDVNSPGTFRETNSNEGEVDSGPAFIPGEERGLGHIHGLGDSFVDSGNSYSLNHGEGKGDVSTPDVYTSTSINIHFERGSTAPTMNSVVEPTTVVMSTGSRTIFDSSLSFYLRNNEQIPIISDYFRLKWLIKAY